MSPIQNLILAFISLAVGIFYPEFLKQFPNFPLPAGEVGSFLQWLLVTIAGWNVKAATHKSSLPKFSLLFKKKV